MYFTMTMIFMVSAEINIFKITTQFKMLFNKICPSLHPTCTMHVLQCMNIFVLLTKDELTQCVNCMLCMTIPLDNWKVKTL